nr:DUF2637 domain-containing protein [Bifidobacterium sp. SO1]
MWPGLVVAVILALLAFIISFDALRVVGLACGINERLAWMFPLIIDGSTLAFTWAAWAFKTRRLSTVYPWLMLVLFSIISLIGNALHAHPVEVNGLLLPDWVPPLIMTVPPVALLATTHMIVLAAGRSFDNDDLEWEHDEPAEKPEAEPAADDFGALAEMGEPEGTDTEDSSESAPAAVVPMPAEPEPVTQPDPVARPAEPEPEPVESEPVTEPAADPAPEPPTPPAVTEQPEVGDAVPEPPASPRPSRTRMPVNPIFLEPTPPGDSLSERWARENGRTISTPVARILGIDEQTPATADSR